MWFLFIAKYGRNESGHDSGGMYNVVARNEEECINLLCEATQSSDFYAKNAITHTLPLANSYDIAKILSQVSF
jgi:hypothetical protein